MKLNGIYSNTLLRKVRLILKGALSSFVFNLLYKRGFNKNDTIIICGSFRSGSTWLAEMLSAQDGHIQIFEPMHPEYVKPVKKIFATPANRAWREDPYIPLDRDWPEGKKIFNDILSGKLVNPWIASQIPFRRLFSIKQLVVKFVRANLLLGWLSQLEGIRKPVLVIRHPCAVIASELLKGWPPAKHMHLNNSYLEGYPEIKKKCEKLEQPEELAALGWCLRYHAPLNSPRPHKFILVSYEALVRKGHFELQRIYNSWGLPLSEAAVNKLFSPSDTSTNESYVNKGKDPLAGWKSRLEDAQISNILKVLKIFKIDLYSENLEPDYNKLANYGYHPLQENKN